MSGFEVFLFLGGIVAVGFAFKYFKKQAQERDKIAPQPTKGERPKRGE